MSTLDIIVGRYEEDKETLKEKGLGYLGRHYVGNKHEYHLANKVFFDIARPHLINIFGKRGTGKSYTLGVIAEELMELDDVFRQNISILIFDPMGVYWSMKLPNEKDKDLLLSWGLEPKGYNIKIAIPAGLEKKYIEQDMEFDILYSIKVSELSVSDWIYALGLEMNSYEAVLLDKAVGELKEHTKDYTLDDLVNKVLEIEESKESKILAHKLDSTRYWGIFSDESTPLNRLIKGGECVIVDLSQFGLESGGWSVRTLAVGLLVRKILLARIESRKIEEKEKILKENLRDKYENYIPITWILIDEAHQFLPADSVTASSLPLLQAIKIGRQPGVSLVLATQMPFKLHQEAISQGDIVISHRLTAKKDIHALEEVMQTYQKYDLVDYFDMMPREKGSAIIMDDNSERIYEIRVRPRKSWHAGESAIAKKEEE